MRIFKVKGFKPGKEGLGDAALRAAIEEIEAGLVDGHLGGELVKKRIARQGQGKKPWIPDDRSGAGGPKSLLPLLLRQKPTR